MKKLIKISLWITGSFFSIIIIGLFLTYFWLSTKWKSFYTENEMIEISKLINSSENLPDNFYMAYDKIYPNQRNKTLKDMSFEIVWIFITNNQDAMSKYKQSNSIWVTFFIDNKVPSNYHSWSSYITAHGIEEFTSETKCLNFIYNNLKIKDLSLKCFSKPISDLTIKENIELILRIEKPSLYKFNPEMFHIELSKYE